MAASESFAMRATLFGIRKSFPDVKQLQTEELQEWIDQENSHVILLDVRETDEYKVSHLPGAIQVKSDESIEEVITKAFGQLNETKNDQNVNVVTYCSIGYRSSKMAQKISDELKGMKESGALSRTMNVYNLEGSIFKWANEGRKIMDCENKETKYCHPYNVMWGKLLDYNLRKYPETNT